MALTIAIDGPAGAGKSTIARALAMDLGILYVDTGAMYRAMAYYMLRNGIPLEDQNRVEAASKEVNITLKQDPEIGQLVYLNDVCVEQEIRKPQVSEGASVVSAYGAVRKKLVELQQKMAAHTALVMDGRDIGTAVLPHASYKFYLTADPHVRALRRKKDLLDKGMDQDLEKIEQEIRERDARDMNREISPLRQASDAMLVDTSQMTIREVVQLLEKVCAGPIDREE